MPSLFLRERIQELKDGATGEDGMLKMRRRFTTAQSLRTHTCALRNAYDGPLDSRGEWIVKLARKMLGSEQERVLLNEWIGGYGRKRWVITGNITLDSFLTTSVIDEQTLSGCDEGDIDSTGVTSDDEKTKNVGAPGHTEGGVLSVDQNTCIPGMNSHERPHNLSTRKRPRAIVMTLLPLNVQSVHVNDGEVRECVKLYKKRIVARSEHAQSVDGTRLLLHARSVLADPDTHGTYEITLALLLVSGRRTTEVLNGKSLFETCVTRKESPLLVRQDVLAEEEVTEPTETHATSLDKRCWCQFSGQLKTRSIRCAYRIPLLVSLETFDCALRSLRSRQPVDISSWTNSSVSRRYGSGLGAYMRSHSVYGVLACVHRLRSVYVWLAYSLFSWENRWITHVACEILGHASIDEANAYVPMHVKIERALLGGKT